MPARRAAKMGTKAGAAASASDLRKQNEDQLYDLVGSFLTSDRGGDGAISRPEWRQDGRRRSVCAARRDQAFRKADADHDGVLWLKEYLMASLLVADELEGPSSPREGRGAAPFL